MFRSHEGNQGTEARGLEKRYREKSKARTRIETRARTEIRIEARIEVE
jgi:hypothetical protein